MQANIDTAKLKTQAEKVLKLNDRKVYTVPSATLYPHQWLWDSCFIAIGLANANPQRAAEEVRSLLGGQWQNGMVPHLIFKPGVEYEFGPTFWKSHKFKSSPESADTSAITQPPLISIAALAVADKLPEGEGKVYLKELYPKLLAYHQWIYRERDADGCGLAILVHPWESGVDNSPAWMTLLNKTPDPRWIGVFLRLKIHKLTNKFRKDVVEVPAHQRVNPIESYKLLYRALRFRRRGYDNKLHLKQSKHLLEDLVFNSILIAANRALLDISTIIGETLPGDLEYRMRQTEYSLENLWDSETGQYYPRFHGTHELMRVPSIATFLPLFSGSIQQPRADRLVKLLEDTHKFHTKYPVPTVPVDSKFFDQHHYWQGPTWVNMNWMIFKGLVNYGHLETAKKLRDSTLAMVDKSGMHEYFSPLTGEGYGIDNFSWTAALVIDLLNFKIE